MTADYDVTSSTDPSPLIDPDAPTVNAPGLQGFIFALFFIFGGITSLNDVIIPKLKDLFSLNYAQANLVQSAFFIAYLLVSLPAAAILKRIGYMRTATVGLIAMTLGCLLFIPASAIGQFIPFLFALFVLAAGITIVQVVANPLISLLGPPRTAHSRLTFAQFFNSFGTTIFPLVGSTLILGSISKVDAKALTGSALTAYRTVETHVVVQTYIGLAAALAIVAAVVWSRRHRLPEAPTDSGSVLAGFRLLRRPRFGIGALCIFLYVGAEVAIGSTIVKYLMQPSVMGLQEKISGDYVALYWFGAMVGRFFGSWILRIISPGKLLASAAVVAIILLLLSANTAGVTAGFALLAIGLFNSIMFPTIFTLASEGLGSRTAEGSGIICMAIFGGAVIPYYTGVIADHTNLRVALALPAVCYAVIVAYGLYTRRSAIGQGSAMSAH